MSDLRIRPVEDRRDLRRFVTMPRHIYADDPHWVAPLTFERMQHLDERRNPFLRGIDLRYWLAFRGDRCVGRISAQINRRHLERYGDATGHFGFLEAEDDPEVFAALLETAEADLRARGMRRIRGPFNPSINDECGLLIEGFDTGPSMMMGHARPYYRPRLEALGYRKAKDLIAYDFAVRGAWPPRVAGMLERVRKNREIRVRPLEMRRYREEIATICRIFNDAWADNWGFIPFGEEEAHYLAHSIRPLVDANCFAIGELGGEPVAMCVTLPNLNEAIRGLDGRILPFGWAVLLWRLRVRGLRSWRMPLMGVSRRFHRTRHGAALALLVIDALRAYHARRGVERAELSWVLEDNRPVRDLIEGIGGVPYKTYRIFEKSLT